MASKVGAGNVKDSSAAASSSRRTSTSLLVDTGVQREFSDLSETAAELQRCGHALVGGDQGRPWGPQGKLPAPGQYCYEALQVTRYEQGQYFKEHDDAFPIDMARQNKFQRHATLLVYLNSVANGGATSFTHLGLAVHPAQGRALLFFPAFADGTPDTRYVNGGVQANCHVFVCRWQHH